MQATYADTALDENPIIVPSCGHLITVESMDAHMQMTEFFTLSLANPLVIEGLKRSPKPFEAADLKGCPLCRMPLRDINRYGRIVRRAFVDEATKKFIVWANSTFIPLASRLTNIEKKLANATKADGMGLCSQSGSSAAELIQLKGYPDYQIARLSKIIGKQDKYKELFQLRKDLKNYHKSVDEKEQPFSRIFDLVQNARLLRGIQTDFDYTPEILQTRSRLLATVLLLRCDHLILLEFLTLCKEGLNAQAVGNAPVLEVDFTHNRKACDSLIQESRDRQQPANVIEGQLFWARFAALERGVNDQAADLVPEAHRYLTEARSVCEKYPGQTKGMLGEVEAVETMLNGGTFYAPVTNDEKAAVYAAMASEFSGTGHWYYCEQGHPFTVGECGMPMETSVCPQCGSAVGGQRHENVVGVTRAGDFEAQFGRMQV